MSNRTSHEPNVGNRNDGEDVPYAVDFEKARQGRTGSKMKNPNDTDENTGLIVSENYNNGGAPSDHDPSSSSSRTRHETLINPKTHKPVTQIYQHRTSGIGRGSESGTPKYLEAPKNSRDYIHGAPRRTRLTAADSRIDEFDKGSSSVPRFGEWENKDHVSAQGYTRDFSRISEERTRNMHGGYVLSPRKRTGALKQTKNNESMSCCFFWRRKV